MDPSFMQHLMDSVNTGRSTCELETFNQMLSDLQAVDGDCVVFNFECCSGCDEKTFPYQHIAHDFVHTLLEQQWLVVFSDFSLKWLIANWEERRFGKNPFVRVGA